MAARHALRTAAAGAWRGPGGARRGLWTPGTGYRPQRDNPHRRPALRLREGADARIRNGHPWIFSRDVVDPEALAPFSPCLVNVHATDDDVIGVALYNDRSSIAARVLSTTAFLQIDSQFFAERLRRCLEYRERFFPEPFYRLAHGEADGLPGLIIDRYGDQICLQPSAPGLDSLLWPIADALEEVVAPKVIVIRQDAPGRRREGAQVRREVLKGPYHGPTELRENGVTFAADLLNGQKTGWYYDQRDNRAMLAALAPLAPRVLDLYSYVGGFGVTMAQYGSEQVVCVDSSGPAMELCSRAAAINSVGGRVKAVRSDVLEYLGGVKAGEFDLVIVDPPNLGADRASQPKALRMYERLVSEAARVCAAPGLLFVASCTYHISEADLRGAVGRGLRWAGRTARVAKAGSQAADHPGHPVLAESSYLRSLLLNLD